MVIDDSSRKAVRFTRECLARVVRHVSDDDGCTLAGKGECGRATHAARAPGYDHDLILEPQYAPLPIRSRHYHCLLVLQDGICMMIASNEAGRSASIRI